MDRGVVVAALITAVLLVALIKPWPSGPVETESMPSAPVPSPQAPAPAIVTLDELRTKLQALPGRRVSGTRAMFGTIWDTVVVSSMERRPDPAELGLGCTGGALLGEGNEQIAVAFGQAIAGFTVERLFDPLPPVAVPVVATDRAPDGLILATAAGVHWPAGHYALTLEVGQQSHVLPFCIGRMLRDVDYSMIVWVPDSLDSAAARNEFITAIER